VKRALKQYNTLTFNEMVQNCMAQDLSWKVGTDSECSVYRKKFVIFFLFPEYSPHLTQGPAKKWEEVLLSLGVEGSQPGMEGEEIAPLAKENVATP
jgi:granule-bound starch synthase